MVKTFKFTLIISKPTMDDEAAADRLYAMGCDDGLFGVSNGEYSIDFDRESLTWCDAVFTAVQNVNLSGIGSRVLGVRKIDGNSIS